MNKVINEKDVENKYRDLLSQALALPIVSYCNSDGYIESDDGDRDVLLEFKHKTDLTNSRNITNILIQTIYYMKKIKGIYNKMPKLVFIGTKNHFMLVDATMLYRYLDYEIDWDLAPSKAYKDEYNYNLVTDLQKDSIQATVLYDAQKSNKQLVKDLQELFATGKIATNREQFVKEQSKLLGVPWIVLNKLYDTKGYDMDIFVHPYENEMLFYSTIGEGYRYEYVNHYLLGGYMNYVKTEG